MALNRSPEFCLKLIFRYLLKAGHFPGDTCSGHFWPQGHNLNKLGRSQVCDATYQISIVIFDKKIFSCFPYISICIT